jgi:hypothetical protein
MGLNLWQMMFTVELEAGQVIAGTKDQERVNSWLTKIFDYE